MKNPPDDRTGDGAQHVDAVEPPDQPSTRAGVHRSRRWCGHAEPQQQRKRDPHQQRRRQHEQHHAHRRAYRCQPERPLPGEHADTNQDANRCGDLHDCQPGQPVRLAAQQARADGAAKGDADQHPRQRQRERVGRGVKGLRHQAEPHHLERERRKPRRRHHPPHGDRSAHCRGAAPCRRPHLVIDGLPRVASIERDGSKADERVARGREQERASDAERSDQDETR